MQKESDCVLALEFLTAGASAVLPQGMERAAFTTESFQVATTKLHTKARDWTMARGIQGIGVGQKITKGNETEELAVRVYVERKKARSKVSGKPVPKTVTIPEVGKITTDVVEIGRVKQELFRERVRPAMPGSGLGHKDVTVGTFGCLVRKKGTTSGLYILSNSHVLANQGLAKIGDEIVQPGEMDGGRVTTDTIAYLAEFVPFDFSDGFNNLVDAAIAKVKSTQSVREEIRILGIKPVGVSTALSRGMRVKKVGRTTDFTIGQITDLHYRLRLTYQKSAKTKASAGLRDQVLCTRYTQGGDSGSAVLNDQNRIVGLHFAGSPSTSIFNRITNVFEALDIELP